MGFLRCSKKNKWEYKFGNLKIKISLLSVFIWTYLSVIRLRCRGTELFSGLTKAMSNSFGSWNFQNTLETDFLPVGEQKVSTDEICFLSTSKLQLGHQMPHAVCSVTIFCNFKMFFHHQPCASPSIFLSILGHVHSKSRTAYRTTQWFQDAKWVPLCQSQSAWQTT